MEFSDIREKATESNGAQLMLVLTLVVAITVLAAGPAFAAIHIYRRV